jgi:hypothetical protein
MPKSEDPGLRWFRNISPTPALEKLDKNELDPQSIKALVWNIKKTEEIGWSTEYLLYGFGKDLHLMQEAYRNALFHNTLNLLGPLHWDMGVSILYRRDNNTATGVAIGSIATSLEARASHTPDTEPVIQTPKANIFYQIPAKR